MTPLEQPLVASYSQAVVSQMGTIAALRAGGYSGTQSDTGIYVTQTIQDFCEESHYIQHPPVYSSQAVIRQAGTPLLPCQLRCML